VKIWREDAVHYENECITFNGSLFQARCDTGKSPLFAKHWMCLATAGADGKPIRHRGTFDPEVEYREHDAVLVGGSSFVALRDGPEHRCPGSGWQLLAGAGRDGRDGATGPRGERGERGSNGPRGANPRRQSPAGASILRPMLPCRCCRTAAGGAARVAWLVQTISRRGSAARLTALSPSCGKRLSDTSLDERGLIKCPLLLTLRTQVGHLPTSEKCHDRM
jgi:hypothetical protein